MDVPLHRKRKEATQERQEKDKRARLYIAARCSRASPKKGEESRRERRKILRRTDAGRQGAGLRSPLAPSVVGRLATKKAPANSVARAKSEASLATRKEAGAKWPESDQTTEQKGDRLPLALERGGSWIHWKEGGKNQRKKTKEGGFPLNFLSKGGGGEAALL